MIHELSAALTPAVMERLTLLLNHVLSREPAATQRLQAHVGAVLQGVPQGWPSVLPEPPQALFRITPAGLFEWMSQTPEQAPNLRVVLDASNPAAMMLGLLSGKPPNVHVEGDSRLAADVDWLVANLRWDLADDLQSLFGPAVAQVLSSLGAGLRAAADRAMRSGSELAERWRRPAR
jgi:ubiquinone biosynthesis accessory factor UbiJ